MTTRKSVVGDSKTSIIGVTICSRPPTATSLLKSKTWLRDVVEAIEDPLTAIKRRGLPTRDKAELFFLLTLTGPPELEQLNRWAAHEARGDGALESLYEVEKTYPAPPADKRAGLGFWGVVGATVLGFGIADWLSFRRRLAVNGLRHPQPVPVQNRMLCVDRKRVGIAANGVEAAATAP